MWAIFNQNNGALEFYIDFQDKNPINIVAHCNDIKADRFVVKNVLSDGTIKVMPSGYDDCNTLMGKVGTHESDVVSIYLSENSFSGSYIKDCKTYTFHELEEVYYSSSGQELTHALYYTGWNQFHPICVSSNSSVPVEEREGCPDGDCNSFPEECQNPKTLELAVSIDKNCLVDSDIDSKKVTEDEMTTSAIQTVNAAGLYYKTAFNLDIKIVEIEFVDLNLAENASSAAEWEGANNYWHSVNSDPNCTNQHDFAVHFSCSRNGPGNGTVGGVTTSGFGAVCGTPKCGPLFSPSFSGNYCDVNNYNSTTVVEIGPDFSLVNANTLAHELAHGFNVDEGPENFPNGYQFADIPWCCETIEDICNDMQIIENGEPLECTVGSEVYVFTKDCLSDQPVYSIDENGFGVILDGCDVVIGCGTCDEDLGCFYCPGDEVNVELYRDFNLNGYDDPIWIAWSEPGSSQVSDIEIVEENDEINFVLSETEPIREVWTAFTVNGENYVYTIPINVLDSEGVAALNPFHDSYFFRDCGRIFHLDPPPGIQYENFRSAQLDIVISPTGVLTISGEHGASGTVFFDIVTFCGDVFTFSFDVNYIECLYRSNQNFVSYTNNEVSKPFDFEVIPNPNLGTFKIELSKKMSGKVEVYSKIGILMHSVSFENESTISALSNKLGEGIYFLKIQSDEAFKTKKICVLEY